MDDIHEVTHATDADILAFERRDRESRHRSGQRDVYIVDLDMTFEQKKDALFARFAAQLTRLGEPEPIMTVTLKGQVIIRSPATEGYVPPPKGSLRPRIDRDAAVQFRIRSVSQLNPEARNLMEELRGKLLTEESGFKGPIDGIDRGGKTPGIVERFHELSKAEGHTH